MAQNVVRPTKAPLAEENQNPMDLTYKEACRTKT